MASRTSSPRSRSRSSTGSSDSSDTTMNDAPPLTPVRPRPASHGNPATPAQPAPSDPTFSLLLSLPRELRDRIYAFALVSQFPFWWPAPSSPRHNVALNLLTASRQIHSEATPILYSFNKFLFTHPSDCNIFRVISSPYSENITSVYLRIREKDVKLWTTYLGSKTTERSMKADLPKLKSLWIFLRCGTMGTPGMIGQLGGGGGMAAGGGGGGGLPAGLAAQVQAVQHALGGQMNALQQQVQSQIQALQHQVQIAMGHAPNPNNNGQAAAQQNGQAPMPFVQFATGGFQPPHHHPHPPPPPPHAHGLQNNPPPNPSPLAAQMAAQPQAPQLPQQPFSPPTHPHAHHTHPQTPHPPHTFYASFLRWEREMGLENLCLSLQETRPIEADVKIVCIMKLPKQEVMRLLRVYPEELSVDRNGDARTRFRRVHGVDVSLEVSGYEVVV